MSRVVRGRLHAITGNADPNIETLRQPRHFSQKGRVSGSRRLGRERADGLHDAFLLCAHRSGEGGSAAAQLRNLRVLFKGALRSHGTQRWE
jgi:hypothetical protein